MQFDSLSILPQLRDYPRSGAPGYNFWRNKHGNGYPMTRDRDPFTARHTLDQFG